MAVELEHFVLARRRVVVVERGVRFEVRHRHPAVGVAHLGDVLGRALIGRLTESRFHVGVLRIHLHPLDVLHRNVHVVGRVEPAAPEPVEVHPRGVLHGAEEVRRRRMFEGPATAVLLEGVVEQVTAHHGLTQNVQSRGGLAVGVVAKLVDRLRVGHDGADAGLVTAHVLADVSGASASRRVIAVKFLLRQELHEGVQPLVHPRPLALVRVDDHGEEIVPHLVDDDADHAVLGARAVRAVWLGAAAVEADHRVLHSNPLRVDGNGHRVRVVHREFAVGLEGLGYGLGAVLFPQRVALLGVVAHGQRRRVPHLHRHRVPNELAARRPPKVADVLGVEDPGLLPRRLGLFVLPGLLFRHDEHRLIVLGLGLLKAAALGAGEHGLGVGQRPC